MTDAVLRAQALAAYQMPPQSTAALADAMARCYVAAYSGTYRQALRTVGAGGHPWQVGGALASQAHAWAWSRADGVTATYHAHLAFALDQILEITPALSPSRAFGEADRLRLVLSQVASWVRGMAPWKAQQIANDAAGTGHEEAMSAFLRDVREGVVTDPLTGGGISLANYAIAILPGEASPDECQDYAGRVFQVSEEGDIPDFPLHVNCPHEKVLVAV